MVYTGRLTAGFWLGVCAQGGAGFTIRGSERSALLDVSIPVCSLRCVWTVSTSSERRTMWQMCLKDEAEIGLDWPRKAVRLRMLFERSREWKKWEDVVWERRKMSEGGREEIVFRMQQGSWEGDTWFFLWESTEKYQQNGKANWASQILPRIM